MKPTLLLLLCLGIPADTTQSKSQGSIEKVSAKIPGSQCCEHCAEIPELRKEIAEQPLIIPKTGFTRQLFDKHFRPYRSNLRITMELPSVGMIKRFVAAGLGVSLISESFARDQARSGDVKLIPISDVELWRELGLIYRRDRTLPRVAAAFVALLKQDGTLTSDGRTARAR